jgi:hypothetical protein
MSDRLLQGLAIGIAVLAVLVRFWVSYRTHALGEDALITLRYAENIAAGRGWVYNPGERVLGTTTPLFTMILALMARLGLPAIQAGIAIDILADGVTCYLIARLLARPEVRCPAAGLFAALLYALSSTPISVSISGMETALVACAGMTAVHAYVAGRARVLCLCGAALFLLRIDGLLIFAFLLAGLIVRTRKIPWDAIGLFALVLSPWLLFATLYFGSPVPASLVAKLTVYSRTQWTPGSFTDTVAFNTEAFRNQFTLGWPQRIVTALFIVGGARIFWDGLHYFQTLSTRVKRADDDHGARHLGILAPALMWLVLYYGAMFTSRVPAFPWYFLPPWPLFICTALIGASGVVVWAAGILQGRIGQMGHISERVRASHDPGADGAAPSCRDEKSFAPTSPHHVITTSPYHLTILTTLALFTALGLLHINSISRDISAAQAREDTLRRPLGLWLGAHVGPEERVLMEPIGYAGYYSGRRILDMVGLVSPEVLPFYRTPRALSGIVKGLRPEWLCLRVSERDLLHAQDPSLPGAGYAYVQAFPSESDPAFVLYHRR